MKLKVNTDPEVVYSLNVPCLSSSNIVGIIHASSVKQTLHTRITQTPTKNNTNNKYTQE